MSVNRIHMPSPVRTAVFPVAGRGTRFLPATKAVPKEMLPIVDRPLIQFAVEEALEAGVEIVNCFGPNRFVEINGSFAGIARFRYLSVG